MGRSLKAQGHPLSILSEQRQILNPRHRSHRSFEESLRSHGMAPLRATGVSTLQINLGKMCNQTCEHCHVDAGPDRKEIMTRQTMEACLRVLDAVPEITTIDLTGGAPELNPNFQWFVEEIRQRGPAHRIIDRCNLTILMVKRFENLAEFLANHQIEIIASLPCYLESNCDKQRGQGVFADSIAAIAKLNAIGYGQEGSGLHLHLVYNPVGPSLPPRQEDLEQAYKRELQARYGLIFNRLYTITNIPINRFLDSLLNSGRYDEYMQKLIQAYNPEAAENVMCRQLISVGWDGKLYDCDFNQMLELEVEVDGGNATIFDFDLNQLAQRTIMTGMHCYACTAGAGSSCGGSTVR